MKKSIQEIWKNSYLRNEGDPWTKKKKKKNYVLVSCFFLNEKINSNII